jgi:hypothetical protein
LFARLRGGVTFLFLPFFFPCLFFIFILSLFFWIVYNEAWTQVDNTFFFH